MRRAAVPLTGFAAFVLALLLAGPTGRAPCAVRQPPAGKYKEAIQQLQRWIAREVADKNIPGLSLALIDDQDTVWEAGFGHADPKEKTLTGAETVYRVGSVSKPFTALALMLLVQQGLLDLDAPVTRYLPEFRPKDPFKKAITLRQLLSHRSGLVRECPVGNYFDMTSPSLADMVKSLNQTE